MLERNRILTICRGYAASGFHVLPVPADKVRTARESWKVPPPEDRVLVFVDATVFGSGKTGLVVWDEGLIWDAGLTGQHQWQCSWKELGAAAVRVYGDNVQIGGGAVSFAGAASRKEPLVACLRELQRAAIAAGAPGAVAYVPEGYAFPAAGQPAAGAEVLKELIEGMSGPWVLVAPAIPEKKQRNARAAMKVPPDESVLALCDATLFGSAKDGLVVGTRGIYWNNSIVGGDSRGRLTWDELARTRVARAAGMVILGETDWYNPEAGSEASSELFLQRLQWWARARLSPEERRAALQAAGEAEPGAPAGAPRWHLAVNGQQFGPYDEKTVGSMAAAGQVNADVAYAWADGMTGWVPLRQVPELAAVLPAAAPPAAPGPPPAPVAPAAAAPAQPSGAVEVDDEDRIDVNTASVHDLLVLPGMTLGAAELLVHERETRGGLRDVDQVGQLLRLRPHQVEKMRGMVVFGRITPTARVIDF